MKQDFNEAVNDLIAWYVRNRMQEDVSEEEFEKCLEEKKEKMVEKINNFKSKINWSSLASPENKEGSNPFVLFLLLMVFPEFGEYDKFIENIVGRKLSEEEFQEYVSILMEKTSMDNLIKFLDENDKIDESIVAPLVKDLFKVKRILLPHLIYLRNELQEKLNSYSK